MYAKFQGDIFGEYDFTGGRISHFLIKFCMGLTTVPVIVFSAIFRDRQSAR